MQTSWPARRTIVVDASLAIWVVVPVVSPVDPLDFLLQWRREGARIAAPMLWLAESASALRALVHTGAISLEEGRHALHDLLALEVELLPMTPEQTRAGFEWATRLGQRRAYDAFYLALAEELGAELWCADQRLATSARQAGATWVQSIAHRR
jgi:predicted nucleic acid-binding protein